MELEKEVKSSDGVESIVDQEGIKSFLSSTCSLSSSPEYMKSKYGGPQLALAQHSVNYCGDGGGDGCSND